MDKNRPWEFTCKTCGGQKINVSHIWTILAGPDTESWQEWGQLEADHFWHFKFKEKIEKKEDHLFDGVEWDWGRYLKDNSSSKPEDYEIFENEDNPGNDRYYVNCANCDREIEFGWEKSNRGGRIFPVECSDFIPGKYLPEPRYSAAWQKKGWLKKGKQSE